MTSRKTAIAAMALALGSGLAWGQEDQVEHPRFKVGYWEMIAIDSPHPYPAGGEEAEVVWTDTLTNEAAYSVRLHFSDATSLAEGDLLVVRDRDGRAIETFVGTEAAGRWTRSVFGDSAIVELVAGVDGGGYGVEIDKVGWATVPIVNSDGSVRGGFYSICDAVDPSHIRTADPVASINWMDDCFGQFLCTGWLFSPVGHMMTNAHCANSETEAASLECLFNFQGSSCDLNSEPNPDSYGGATFDRMVCSLDFAIHIIDDPSKGNPATVYGYLPIDFARPANGTQIWIPQHPGGSPKQIDENCSVLDNVTSGINGCADPPDGCGNSPTLLGSADLSFSCAIAGGSSGSPVLNLSDEVVALAHGSTGAGNVGVRMEEIVGELPNFPIDLQIDGPATVDESQSIQITSTATLLLGQVRDVTGLTSWSVFPSSAGTIDEDGFFTANPVDANTAATIRASYTELGVTLPGTLDITIINTTVDTPIIEVTLLPSVDTENLFLGQSFTVDVALETDGDTVLDVRLLQFDSSLTSGATVDSVSWPLEELIDSVLYGEFQDGGVFTAFYIALDSQPGLIVHLTSTPQVVARLDVTFTGDGTLDVLGTPTPPTTNESVRLSVGFDSITEFSQALNNLAGDPLLLAEGDTPLAVVGSDPPDGAIDARQTSDLAGNTPAGWQWIDLTFNGDPLSLTSSDFTVTQEGGVGPAPGIAIVAAVDAQTIRLVLDAIIEAGAWTTVTHDASGSGASVGYLPGDSSGDGTTSPTDILALIDFINGVGDPLPEWSTDMDRSGETNSADILRLIDLLNGAGIYEAWNGVSLP